MSTMHNYVVQLPPLQEAPTEVQVAAAAYEQAVTDYLEAETEALGASGYLDNAEHLDADAVAAALRTGGDPHAAAHHVRDAAERVRVVGHVVTARAADLKRATAALLGACLAHRDHMAVTIAPRVREGEAGVREALAALNVAQRRYREQVDAGVWWDQLAPRNLPTYGQAPRAAADQYAGEYAVTDRIATGALNAASVAGIVDLDPEPAP